MKRILFIAGLVPVASFAAVLQDGTFERTAAGEKTGWRTTSAAGRLLAPGKGLEGSGAIGVEGVGTNNCKWLSPPVTVKSGSVYGFSAMVKADDVIGKLVKFGRSEISKKNLKGFMMAPWASCDTKEHMEFNLKGVDLFADALKA